MTRQELLILKDLIHQVAEDKLSIDDLLSWVLKQLEEGTNS